MICGGVGLAGGLLTVVVVCVCVCMVNVDVQ